MNTIAIYPGTFDPITRGHENVIRRAAKLFSQIVIGVAENPKKQPIFSLEERVEMLKVSLDDCNNVAVYPFSGLLIHCAQQQQAKVIIRGIRSASDCDFEFQLASMNRALDATIETIFFPSVGKYAFISSSLVKEVAELKGDIDYFLHPFVVKKLAAHFSY